ncbi:MAG: carbamoyltransferase HypF [Actinomycetota bacterium]|nr:carbamoyltransferase HypF [Actinomycetota bacterium]
MTGTVQGVGFRPFVYRLATELGLDGEVANDSLGVTIEVAGPRDRISEFGRRLRAEAPPLARLDDVVEVDAPAPSGDGVRPGFRIVDSRAEGAPAVAVSVDVATCDDCLRELVDPDDRRFGYPFINCTNCGPRYTIIQSIPYDRASTTMSVFPMCADCRREYEDPANRRFHAEPNACPVCGPHLSYLSAEGVVLAERKDALERAAADLRAGRILAVKGLGGYHLACDATDEAAVGELRRRKARDDKPFALMVTGLDQARTLCHLTPEAEAALASLRRPIVLAPRRAADGAVAAGVAPRLPELGLMLPYTPLHHLLMARVGRPLVMTSGDLSDEPIAHDDTDARTRLGPMVDAILTHNRAIHIRCDDSVVRARPLPSEVPARSASMTTTCAEKLGPRVQTVRRSRGYAPEPIRLAVPTTKQILAVGAELKNTVAVAKGQNVIVSHHIGDLEHLAAYRSFLQAVDHLCHLTGVTPEIVAHDLHPEYLSTKYATELDVPLVGVQHHHAHIASCLVEHGRAPADGPVLGVAFDGLGLGCDDTIWGGEFLMADLRESRRVGNLRPVPLVGGNLASREPWRMAVVWALEALGVAEAERYGKEVDERWRAVVRLAERPDALVTTSAGRLFDAVAALLGLHPRVTYEAQAAIALEALATIVPVDEAPDYPIATTAGDRIELDPAPLIARVVAERDRGTPVPVIAAGFHAGLGRGVAELATKLAAENGLDTVALSGGVFQNARLTRVVESALASAGLTVLVHQHLPPNDGGISVGQAAIAAARCG